VPYPEYFEKQQIVHSNIAMPSFMMHRSVVRRVAFTSGGCGDFAFLNSVLCNVKEQR